MPVAYDEGRAEAVFGEFWANVAKTRRDPPRAETSSRDSETAKKDTLLEILSQLLILDTGGEDDCLQSE